MDQRYDSASQYPAAAEFINLSIQVDPLTALDSGIDNKTRCPVVKSLVVSARNEWAVFVMGSLGTCPFGSFGLWDCQQNPMSSCQIAGSVSTK